MDGLGFNVFLNPQVRDIGASHQHLSRFLSLGLNLPHVDHQHLSFETVMPEALPVPAIGQNVIVETSQGGTSEATCSSYTPSNSISMASASHQDERIMDNQAADGNYYCDKCEKDFKFEDTYAEHLRTFHKVLKPYSCHECQDTFRQKFSVNTHLRKEHNFDIPIKKAKVRKLANGMYACDLCGDIFPKLSKAYSHRLRHYPKRHVCPHCDMSFFEYKNLKKHLTIHEKPSSRSTSVLGETRKKSSRKVKLAGGVLSRKKKVFCQECEKGFHNNYSLKLHIKINHEGVKPFSCDLCSSAFCVKRSLELHKLKTHKIKLESRIRQKKIGRTQISKKHLCEVCSKQFSSKYQFRIHCKTHMGESGKSFPCFLCEETFHERDSVANHLKEEHNLRESNLKFPKRGPKGLYVCQDKECLKEYARAHDYFEHRQESHGDKRFVCPVCQKAFTKTTIFRNHFNIHNNIKPYVCLVCKVSFSTRGSLNLHMKSHFKTNPFYCAACNKTYASSETFKSHRAEHDGNSPFMCEKCYRGFKVKSELEKHLFWSHRVLKRDYRCKFCNHLFVSKCTLNKHLKNACISLDSSKIMKNICQFCGKTYKHFSSLNKHLKTCEHNVRKELAENPDPPKITRQCVVSSQFNEEDVQDIEVMVCYICKNCFFSFPEQSLFFNHVKMEHSHLKIANEIIIALYDKNNPPDFKLTDKYLSNMDKTCENILQIRLIKYICNICFNGIPYASKSLFLKHLDKFHPKYQPEPNLLQLTTIPINKEKEPVQNSGANVLEESKGTLPEKNLRRSLRQKPKTSSKLPEKALNNDINSSSKIEHACETCGARYVSKNALERHVSKLHPQDINDKENGAHCNDGSDKKSEDLNEKVEQRCKICKIVYSKKHFLDKHVAIYHPDYNDPQPKSCVVNLTMTMESLIKPSECFQCTICSVTYSRRHNLENHVRKLHLKEILQKTSESELDIDDYIESPSSSSKSTYLACDVCQERYKVKRYLEAHIRKKHPDQWKDYEGKEQLQKISDIDPDDPIEEFNVEYYCKICRLPYNLKRNLERHVENFHPDYYQIYPEDKPFEESVIVEDNSNCSTEQISEAINIQKSDVLQQLVEITKEMDPPRKDQSQNTDISRYYHEGGINFLEPSYQNLSLPTKNPTPSNVNLDKLTSRINNTLTPINQFHSACNLNPSQPVSNFLKKHVDHWKEYDGKEQRQKTSDIDPDDPIEEEFSPDVQFYCKICGLPYNLKKNLERHVEDFHPDYYQIYPKDKPFKESVIVEDNSTKRISKPINAQKPDVLQQLAEIAKDLDPPCKDQSQNTDISGYNTEGGQCILEPSYQNLSLPTKNPTLNYVNLDKPTYIFDNTFTPLNQIASASNFNLSQPVTNFQRIITEPVNYGYANPNMIYEVANFNNGAPKTGFEGYNPNYTPANNQPVSDQHNSEDEDCGVPDSGFDVNYDSDTCDDPKELKDDEINLDDNGLLEQNKALEEKPLNNDSSRISIVLTETEKAKGYFCKICPMYYLRKTYLKTHYWKEHPTEKKLYEELNTEIEIEERKKANIKFFCEICLKRFARKDLLARHNQNVHIRDRCFSCDICKATFTSKDNLKSHSETHIKNTYLCATCLECFKTKELLDEHEVFHINGVPCPECKVSFSKTFLRRHFKKRHRELKYEEIVQSEDDKKSVRKGRKGKRSKTEEVEGNDHSDDMEENNSDTTKPEPRRNPKRVKKRLRKSKINESEDANSTVISTKLEKRKTTSKTEPKLNPKRVKKGLRKTNEIDDSDASEKTEEINSDSTTEGCSVNSTKLRNKKQKTIPKSKLKLNPKKDRKGLKKTNKKR